MLDNDMLTVMEKLTKETTRSVSLKFYFPGIKVSVIAALGVLIGVRASAWSTWHGRRNRGKPQTSINRPD